MSIFRSISGFFSAAIGGDDDVDVQAVSVHQLPQQTTTASSAAASVGQETTAAAGGAAAATDAVSLTGSESSADASVGRRETTGGGAVGGGGGAGGGSRRPSNASLSLTDADGVGSTIVDVLPPAVTPVLDLSHLSEEERLQISAVMARAKLMQAEAAAAAASSLQQQQQQQQLPG